MTPEYRCQRGVRMSAAHAEDTGLGQSMFEGQVGLVPRTGAIHMNASEIKTSRLGSEEAVSSSGSAGLCLSVAPCTGCVQASTLSFLQQRPSIRSAL